MHVLFYSMDGIGHLNACIGLAQSFTKRQHRVSFLLTESFAGSLQQYGFEELLLVNPSKKLLKHNYDSQQKTLPETEASAKTAAIKANAENLRASGFFSGGSTLEKMRRQLEDLEEDKENKSGGGGGNHFIEAFYESLLVFNSQIEGFLEKRRPDLVIVDAFLVPPAIQASSTPWAFLCSCNPLAVLKSPLLPPHASGYAIADDPSSWTEYRNLFRVYKERLFSRYQRMLDAAFNFTPSVPLIDNDILFAQSPHLNIIAIPEELAYTDVAPLPPNFLSVDVFMREEKEGKEEEKLSKTQKFTLPEGFQKSTAHSKLVYFSLGTMGAIDLVLMRRILRVLAGTPHRYIVSKGPLASELNLPPNCWGAAHLPQTAILPLVDLVITHGGHNTVSEAMATGIPLVVLPLFGDQPDNAQRVAEKGFGIRLNTWEFTEQELVEAVDRLLYDETLKEKLKGVKRRIETAKSKEKAVVEIEKLVARWTSEKKVKGVKGG